MVAHIDGPKRPPALSPEERQKRADSRNRGELNDGPEGVCEACHGEGYICDMAGKILYPCPDHSDGTVSDIEKKR